MHQETVNKFQGKGRYQDENEVIDNFHSEGSICMTLPEVLKTQWKARELDGLLITSQLIRLFSNLDR